MRLDHVSYVTSHDQLADTVQRLGSRLGTTFFDGGIHPRFATSSFTAPLLDGKFIEVVCPLDHPATLGKVIANIAKDEVAWNRARSDVQIVCDFAIAVISDFKTARLRPAHC